MVVKKVNTRTNPNPETHTQPTVVCKKGGPQQANNKQGSTNAAPAEKEGEIIGGVGS